MKTCCLRLGDTLLSSHLHICENFLERGRGLIGREPLSPERSDALLIPKCNSVHTFWMSYPIAIIFLDINGNLLKKVAILKQRRFSGCRRAKFVLEVAIDTPWVSILNIGDKLTW